MWSAEIAVNVMLNTSYYAQVFTTKNENVLSI